jgi:hypothetical protein
MTTQITHYSIHPKNGKIVPGLFNSMQDAFREVKRLGFGINDVEYKPVIENVKIKKEKVKIDKVNKFFNLNINTQVIVENNTFKGYNGTTYNDFYEWYRKNKSMLENIPECQESAETLLININSKEDNWLKTKIENHIERSGLSGHTDVINILNKIVNDIDMASMYAKDTAKQNSSERTQILYAKKRGINIESLPAGGKKSWRFILNTGTFGQFPKKEGSTSHSMDYICKDGVKYVDYIMGKVITTQGGGQNQQRQEMHDITNSMGLYIKENPNSNIRFVILMDGDNFDKDGYDIYKQYQTDRILITNSNEYEPK